MYTSAVLNTQESFEGQSLSAHSSSVLYFSPFYYILFLACSFPTLIHKDTHSTERKSIRCTACQTDSTLFTQFICHCNETTVDLSRPSSISSLKRTFSPKNETLQSLFFLSTFCPNFYKLLLLVYVCGCVCLLCVLFVFVPAGAFMNSNTLICLDSS